MDQEKRKYSGKQITPTQGVNPFLRKNARISRLQAASVPQKMVLHEIEGK